MTPATMMNVWIPMMVVRPTASSFSKALSVRRATRSPAPTISRYDISTAAAPNMPSSSPIEVKMKSLSATGTISGLPRPRPVPISPPSDRPHSACTIWKPSSCQSPHGSSQMSTRNLTWSNNRHDTKAAPKNIAAPRNR